MTAYFDIADGQIRAAKTEEELEAIDQRIVHEVGFATMQPFFPAELAAAIDNLFLQWSLWANNCMHHVPCAGPTSEIGDIEDYRRCLLRLQWDLHSIFHERAEQDRSMGDDPRTWYLSILADAEERRDNLALKLRGEHPFHAAERARLAAEAETP